eukprot:282835_1
MLIIIHSIHWRITTKMIMGRRIGSTIIRNLATRIHTQNNNNNNSTQIPPAKKDIVMFGAHEAEVMRVLSDNQFEITFPVSQRVLQRSKARVHASQLEKKHVKFNIVPKKKKVLPPKPPPSSSSSVEKEFAPFVSHMSAEDAAQLS